MCDYSGGTYESFMHPILSLKMGVTAEPTAYSLAVSINYMKFLEYMYYIEAKE